jgi:hypothetical protein
MLWNVIATQSDAEALLQQFGNFHDACVDRALG